MKIPSINRKRAPTIKATNWDKNYRYYFAIGKANPDDGSVQTVPSTKDLKNTFELFLNPSSISISLPFATSLRATNRGVQEESNGIVFRNIQISGTTGILPEREVNHTPAPSVLKSYFPAASAAIQAVGQLEKVSNSIFSSNPIAQQTDAQINQSLSTSGYVQFWALNNWLIEYAEGKKTKGGSERRLLFCCPKDNISYVCSPVSFDLRRDASQPMLYRYSIVLKGYDLALVSPEFKDEGKLTSVPELESVRGVLNRLRRARKAILSASNVIKGIQSDVSDIFQVVNQTVLAAKDVVGVTAEAIDFLPTLKNNANLIAKTTYDQFSVAVSDLNIAGANFVHIFDKSPEAGTQQDQGGSGISTQRNARNANRLGGVVGESAGAGSAAFQTQDSSSSPSTVSPSGEVADKSATSNQAKSAYVEAALNNTDVVSALTIDSIQPLPKQIQEEIDKQTSIAQGTTQGTASFASLKLQEISNNLAYANGSMDAEYAKAYGLPPARASDREITEDDILLAVELQEGKEALDEGRSYNSLFNAALPDPFVTANTILSTQDKMSSPLSGFPVTVKLGQTLSDIALFYMSDANRGREIAIYNDLRAPYLDEAGFSVPITQASHHTFAVTDASQFAVNQFVFLHGTNVASQRGRITNIEKLGSIYRLTVDGTTLLDSFSSATHPYLTARLPGTIGSGDVILVPSDQQSDSLLSEKKTALSERLTYAEKVFRVDLKLGDDGDIVIAPGGDIARSYGYTNAVQAIRLLLETEVGELAQHQSFGLVATVGDRNSTANVNDLVEMVRTSVLSDPRFTDSIVTATLQGNVARIRVEAQGAGGTGLIPVDFEIGL